MWRLIKPLTEALGAPRPPSGGIAAATGTATTEKGIGTQQAPAPARHISAKPAAFPTFTEASHWSSPECAVLMQSRISRKVGTVGGFVLPCDAHSPVSASWCQREVALANERMPGWAPPAHGAPTSTEWLHGCSESTGLLAALQSIVLFAKRTTEHIVQDFFASLFLLVISSVRPRSIH